METLVVFVEGKCGEADIEKKVGRSGEGAILYSWTGVFSSVFVWVS
jgi:hypothetical protein